MTREEARKTIEDILACFGDKSDGAYELTRLDAEDMREAIRTLTAEPCREADDYENEIADLQNRLDIAEYDRDRWKGKVTVLEEKLKSLSAEPCEDAISRQAVINGVDNYIEKAQSTSVIDDFISFEELVVKALQPVTPQQKMGHWIHFAWSDDCSECGWSTGKYGSPTKFCPNCGANMEVSENG